MSVATQIERLQGVRDQIRTKMVALGLANNTDLLQALANKLDKVDFKGDASATLSTSARSKTLAAGYYTGGTIKVPNDYFPVNATNTTATSGDVLTGKKFVDTTGTTVSGTINTASSSDITGTVSVTNPGKITLNTSSTTGSSSGKANASATVAKTLYTGPTGVTNSSLGSKTISASAEVTLASSVASTTPIPSTLPAGTVEVAPSTTRTLYSDTSSTKGYLKSFVVSAIKTKTQPITPQLDAQKIEVEDDTYINVVTVDPIPHQKSASDVNVSATAGISNITSINASQATNGVTVTATANSSTTVPLGYYSSQISKSATQSTKSTTIKPALAGTSGAIELTADINSFTKTSKDNYNNGFITSVKVNPTPTQSKTVTPALDAQTVFPDNNSTFKGFLSSVTVNPIPNQKSDSDITATVSAGISNITSINASQATNGVTVTASASGSTSVPLGYYSSAVSKTPSASKSTTIKPALAGTGGAIELTAGTSSFTKTSTANYSNGFITSVKVNPTPSEVAKPVTPTKDGFTVTPSAGKLLSAVPVEGIPSPYFDTSGVTATASDILKDKVAVSSTGATITGTIPTITPASSGTTDPGTDYTNVATFSRNTNNQYIKIDKGYNNTARKFTISGMANASVGSIVTSDPDSNLSAARTVTPSTSAQYIKISAGYLGNTKITINKMADGSLSSATTTDPGTSYANKATVTPSTSAQYVKITAGYLPNGKITINAMSNGTVSGATTTDPGTSYANKATVTPSTSTQYVPISAGYLPNSKITINKMANGSLGSATTTKPSDTDYPNKVTVTPSTNAQYIQISKGYLPNGKITINAMPNGAVGSATTTNPNTTNKTTVAPRLKNIQYVPITAGYISAGKVTVDKVGAISVTLRSDSWSSDNNTTIGKYFYNIMNDAITDSNNLFVIPSSPSTAQSFGVYAYAQNKASASTGILQFRSVAQPTSNLEYTIYYMND